MSRIADTLSDLQSLDALSTRATPLARLDPRAKILATLAFILTVVSFSRYEVAALIPFALFPVASAAIGDIPARLIGRKLFIAAPFAIMIGLFNPVFDSQPMMSLGGQVVTAGWLSFASILLRFALTVSMAVVLIGSTGFHEVCIGLSRLGLPKAFTTQLLFLYRYIQVLAGEAQRMNLARELRSGRRASTSLATYGSLLGHLLLRAFERAQRIHMAMLSRGYDGELRSHRAMAWRQFDSLFLIACCAALVLAREFNLAQLLGKRVMGVLS